MVLPNKNHNNDRNGVDVALLDYYIFIDTADCNKIKAKNVKTGFVAFTDISAPGHADVVIQSCADALPTGGLIGIGPGDFKIYTQPTSSNNYVSIIGSGPGITKLIRYTTTSGSSLLGITGSNLTVKELTLDGNYPTNTSSVGYADNELSIGGNNVLVSNIEIKNFAGQNGILAYGLQNIIERCEIAGVDSSGKSKWGILTYPITVNPITTIRDCHFTYCDFNAIGCNGYTTIERCRFEFCARPAGGYIWGGGGADGALFTRVINCTFAAGLAGASGIEASNGSWVIQGNNIENVIYGIIVQENLADGYVNGPVVISKNIVKNCTSVGIYILGSTRRTIVTNNFSFDDQVTHTQGWGIYVEGAADNYIIKNNILYGNVTAQIVDVATGINKIVNGNRGVDAPG